MTRYLFSLLILLLVQVTSSAQQERILNYHSDITVNDDRSIMVVETIDIYATGNKIKRGLTRNLPSHRNFNGKSMTMKYDIIEVLRDGKTEPYFTDSGNGESVLYIGEKEVMLSPGYYSYVIKYRIPNQIAFFDAYDEIYWNAIGNDVQFNIEKASCSVTLPPGVNIIQDAAYVGKYGSTSRNVTAAINDDIYEYQPDQSLLPGEGLTVAIGFEKGYMTPPSLFQRFGTLMVILLSLLLLIPYYFHTWMKYGQDPAAPASYPLWDSPDGLSPASLNYIRKGGYRQTNFTASIIHLAIQGFLRIEEGESGGMFNSTSYSLVKMNNPDENLAEEERRIMEYLFAGVDHVSIDGEYNSDIAATYANHKSNLRSQHSDFIHEGDNTHLLWIPIGITILVGIIAVILLVNSPYAEWINTVALISFAPISILGLILYIYLIKKPSVEKLDLRSRINGFKMYLELAEKDRLNLLNPPELTPTHFEAILPYAFALGVAHKWSKKFEDILAKMNYQPEWHNSRSPMMFYGSFGNNFGSNLSGTTTQPSQSGSGSGGGGFSGGGGGGGGVGGW